MTENCFLLSCGTNSLAVAVSRESVAVGEAALEAEEEEVMATAYDIRLWRGNISLTRF